MDIELRIPTAEDLNGIFDVRAQAFAVKETDRERWTSLIDPAGMVAAFLGPRVVGALNVMGMAQWFGGRSVPMGGMATVVVRPEHRGEGIAARMLERSLERMRERELAVSTLYPATTRLYRVAGWEVGGDQAVHRVPTRSLERLPRGESESLRRLTIDDWPEIRVCYDAVASARAGWLDRNDWWWGLLAEDDFEDQIFVYGVDGEHGLDGYMVFAENAFPAGGYAITVQELVVRDPAAAVTLWRFLGGHGMQVDHVTIECGPVEELLLVLPEQDVEQVSNGRWMHRLVDAPAAIAVRGFPADVAAEVHLRVADRLAPWNDGDWVLRVDGGRGELVPGGTGDVQISVGGFSALFTGWGSAIALTTAGAMHHATATDRTSLDAMFAGPAPTMLDEF